MASPLASSTHSPLVVFKVSEEIEQVSIAKYETQSVQDRLKNTDIFSGANIESACTGLDLIRSDRFPRNLTLNGFAEAIHLAYDQHHGLALSPEHVFIVILQGLSIHINQDPEKHRATIGLGHTAPGTKEQIDVCRDNFKLGDPSNNWEEVFPEFSKSIGEKVSKEIHSILDAPFSTSSPLSKAVTALTIMDIFKSYFKYSMRTSCGIPNIALMGTLDDWKDLRARTENLLSKFDDLGFWTEHLYPILDQFVAAAAQVTPIDREFWCNLYKPRGGSGGPRIKGWINVFYPYIKKNNSSKVNQCLDWRENTSGFSGITYDAIPSGFTQTPFTWRYHGKSIDMGFVGGFLGITRAVIPESGEFITPSLAWAVIHMDK